MKPQTQRFATTIRKVEGGFPHSEIPGSKLVRSSPRLIAAYHVLHRLSAPRHPPNALKTLDRSHDRCSLSCKSASRQLQKTSRSQKDRSPSPFENSDLMLAEHDRNGPAFAAATVTFPLNDVDDLPSRAIPIDLRRQQNSCFPDSHNGPSPSSRSNARHMTNWWSQSGSNRRPDACKATALPAELWPQFWQMRTDRPCAWWAWDDSNVRPHPYQGCALTT